MAMKCPNCGKENDDNAKFCQTCGKELAAFYATTPPAPKQEKQSWIAANQKAIVAVIVVVLIVLPLAIFIPVRITVNIYFIGDHSVQVYIDDRMVGNYVLDSYYSTSTHESYSVGVGHHTVVVGHSGFAVLRETVMAWPFIGNSVSCSIPNY